GSVAWENTSNSTPSDNNYATASLTLATETTQYLEATNFGFAVPDGGTILGIKVQIEKGETCADCTVSDVEVKLVKAGSVVGDNKALGANWPATGSGGSRYYGIASATVDGTSTDLWGTTWTPAEVNNSGFGVVISAKENSDSATSIIVDMIRMTVYYDDGVGAGGDTTPPTVSITSPSASATVSGAVNVTADASDGVAVAGVQFQANGSNIGSEDTSAPYEASWDTAAISNGAYTLTAIARDSSNNQTTSSSVAVTVSNGGGGGGGGGDTSPPAVFISSPDNLSTVSGTINFTASASDETGIAGVQFKIDGANFGSQDTSAPYSIPWDTTAVANGNYTLTALATDTSSNQTTSAALTVTVSNGGGAPPGGLVGYWSFNEGSGSTASDSSGNNNTGTLTNGPTWTAGKLGGGLLFDGVDDRVEVSDSGTSSLDVTGTALTMSAWIYPDPVQKTFPHIMSKVKNVNNYLLYINPSGFTVTSVITTANGTGVATCAKSAYTNNQWNLVTSVYDGTTITTYINGVAKTACA
ncbi:MAG: Ig-like domain-containing protein, partial [Patescibacteria group bacterium]